MLYVSTINHIINYNYVRMCFMKGYTAVSGYTHVRIDHFINMLINERIMKTNQIV